MGLLMVLACALDDGENVSPFEASYGSTDTAEWEWQGWDHEVQVNTTATVPLNGIFVIWTGGEYQQIGWSVAAGETSVAGVQPGHLKVLAISEERDSCLETVAADYQAGDLLAWAVHELPGDLDGDTLSCSAQKEVKAAP